MRIVTWMVAGTLLVAGCGGSGADDGDGVATQPTNPSASASGTPSTAPAEADEGVAVDITIKGGKVTPQGKRIKVAVGEPVVLTVTTDAADQVHVHSEPEHEYDIAAGDAKSFTFEVETPGQVAVESHELGVTIVQLVVRP